MSVMDLVFRSNNTPSVSIDDWCSQESHDAKFSKIPTHKNIDGFECCLTCYHNGNFVLARGLGVYTANAFLEALKQIEMTIGTAWRSK